MINQLLKTTIIIFFFLFPLFFLSVTPDFYEYNKMMLLVVTTLILLFLLSVKIGRERRLVICTSTFGLPLLLLTVIIVAATLVQSPNPAVAATTPLGPATWIAGFLFYILLVYSLKTPRGWQADPDVTSGETMTPPPVKRSEQLMNILILDSVILSLYTIALYTGIFPKNSFTPAGSILSTALFIGVITIYTALHIMHFLLPKMRKIKNSNLTQETDTQVTERVSETIKYKNFSETYSSFMQEEIKNAWTNGSGQTDDLKEGNFRGEDENFVSENTNIPEIFHFLLPYLLALLLMLIALIFLLIHLATDQKPVILPFSFGWSIFMEVLKSGKTLIFGIGPVNFLTAFTFARPLGINQTPLWNVIFTSSSSLLLTLATEAGLLAGFFYLVILLKLLKLPKSLANYDLQPLRLTLLFTLILQILLPGSMSIFILTITLLALAARTKIIKQVNLAKIGILNYLLPLFTGAILAVIFYFAFRTYIAEVYFKQSLDALLNNRFQQAYNRQRDAIRLNPYIDRYHLGFSQVNLALANGLSTKKELTDEDKQTIPRLAQQAIDHARSAVILYRTNVVNWDNLAKTYIALLNFATNATDWAEKTIQQRIRLDPYSPGSYLSAGRFYLTIEKYDEAEKMFRQTLAIKSDLANAHYQLGLLFSRVKKYEESFRELQTTKALLVPDSDDAKRVDAQLAELSKLLPKNAATTSAQNLPSEDKQTLEEGATSSAALEKIPTIIPTISLDQPPNTP